MSPVLLSVENLNYAVAERDILNDVSFSIQRGQRVALIGPSGSGKSTILNLLTKTIRPTSGRVVMNGRPIEDYTDRKQYAHQVGIIQQQFNLINEMSVIHNVLAGRLNTWGLVKSLWSLIKPQEIELARAALNAVGMADRIYEYTGNLSGGEQQRIAIARTIVQNPELVLADEPISSLDPATAESIMQLLADITAAQERTLLCSMHSFAHVKKYFDSAIAIKNGRVLFALPVDQITPDRLSQLYGKAA